MFDQAFSTEVFQTQREFIRVMSANLNFVWWAEELVTEETKELKEAFEAHPTDMKHLFKEAADLLYVVAGFYNTMPVNPMTLVSDEQNARLQKIFEEATDVMSKVSMTHRIPPALFEKAFYIVHASNMSKLDPDTGLPIRRDDGKILKGPNYVAPDMTPVVEEWESLQIQIAEQEMQSDDTRH